MKRIGKQVPGELQRLITRMLEKDQNQRPEIEEIIQTDVFQAKARLYEI